MVDVHQVTMDVTGLLSCYFFAAVDAEAEVDLVSQAVPVVVTVAVDVVPLFGFCSFFAAVATVSKMECCSIFCMRRRYIGNSFHYEKGCVTAPLFVIKKSFRYWNEVRVNSNEFSFSFFALQFIQSLSIS